MVRLERGVAPQGCQRANQLRSVGVLSNNKSRRREVGPLSPATRHKSWTRLEFFEEFASRTRNVNSAGNTALTVFHSLHNARCLAALGTIRTLAGVHNLFSIRCFSYFCSNCHSSLLLISMCSSIRKSRPIVYGIIQKSQTRKAQTGNPESTSEDATARLCARFRNAILQ